MEARVWGMSIIDRGHIKLQNHILMSRLEGTQKAQRSMFGFCGLLLMLPLVLAEAADDEVGMWSAVVTLGIGLGILAVSVVGLALGLLRLQRRLEGLGRRPPPPPSPFTNVPLPQAPGELQERGTGSLTVATPSSAATPRSATAVELEAGTPPTTPMAYRLTPFHYTPTSASSATSLPRNPACPIL